MPESILKGSCLCGAVKYVVTGEAKRFYHCHCSRCRKATGTGHASNLFVQPGTLEWLGGEELVRTYKVPEAQRFANAFCTTCGSRLPREAKAMGFVVIPAGSLDVEPPIGPQARIFTGSRAQWSCPDGEMTAYEDYPPQ
jgi:hypothetical protein